jgi:hypothetical protein
LAPARTASATSAARRQLAPDRGDRRRRGFGAERHLDDLEPALVERAGERHRVVLALDRQDRDDAGAAKQRVHQLCPPAEAASGQSTASVAAPHPGQFRRVKPPTLDPGETPRPGRSGESAANLVS